MTAATDTTEVQHDSWQVVYDEQLRAAMLKWAEDNLDALPKAVAEFTKQAEGDGWYGVESPFANALGWRAEDLMKGEVTTMAAKVVTREFEEHPEATGTEVLDHLKSVLRRSETEGLTSSSTNQMSNLLARLRGSAALDFGGGFSGMARWEAEAWWQAYKLTAGAEQAAERHARDQVKEVKMALDRTRSETGRAREQHKLEQAEQNLVAKKVALEARLAEVGAPQKELDRVWEERSF